MSIYSIKFLAISVCLFWGLSFVLTINNDHKVYRHQKDIETPLTGKNRLPKAKEKEYYEIRAKITAYNTVSWQTDDSPCISGDGTYICGRNDVVACPREHSFGTVVGINGRTYVCHDRLNVRFDSRFDISFDKDIKGAREFGTKTLPVKVYK